MLAGAEKHDGNARGVDHADEGADHVADGIGLGDDEAIEGAAGAERGVEVAGLSDAVRADEGLADHEDLVWVGELAELLERRHEAGVVVAAAGGVDEDDVEAVLLGVDDGVGGDVGGVFAVALFEQVDGAAFAGGELLEVADVDAELLDGARAERVCGGDEDAVVVLEEEEGDFGEVGGFADAVDADDGEHVGAGAGGVCGGDFAEEVERRGWGEDAGEGFFHGGAQGGFDGWGVLVELRIGEGIESEGRTCEGGRLHADEVALDGLA